MCGNAVWMRNCGSDEKEPILHASAVAWGDQGCLIVGDSGTGKSSLALELMAYGCDLVGDDRIVLSAQNAQLWMRPMPNIQGQIEARGLGILDVPFVAMARCLFVIDLSKIGDQRLPEQEIVTLLGVNLHYITPMRDTKIGPAVLQLLKSKGRTL